MGRLPDGYEEHRNEDMSYLYRAGEHENLKETGLTDLFTLEDMVAAGIRGGRGRVYAVPRPAEGTGDELMLKQVLHGGLFGRLNRQRFLGAARLLRELRVTAEARDRGVPVPEVAFAAWTHGVLPRLYLATVRVPASRSLEEMLRREPPGRRRLLSISAAARAVREMHDAGLVHSDLNLGNVMLSEAEGPPEGFVIDLDRSWFPARLQDRHRAANLARLLRSLEKSSRLARRVSLLERAHFLRDYCGELGSRYDTLRDLIAHQRHWFMLHRLAWRVGWR